MKKMIPLTNEEKESYENQEICHICEKEFCIDKSNKKEFKLKQKVRDHCHYTGKYRGAAHSICNLRYKITKEIPIVFYNGSTYYYHFIIKRLARKLRGYFHCLGENAEKYITFSVPFKKVIDSNNDNNNNKNKVEIIIYRLKFIDSYRFMRYSLSNIVDNLSGINTKGRKNKFINSMRSMTDLLSLSIDKVSKIDREISQIDEKELKNKFIDNMRSTIDSLLQSLNKISEINNKISKIDKKEPDNRFIDNMRSMIYSLSQSINKISDIDKKIMHINKKNPENKFIDSMRSMTDLSLKSIDKVLEIDKKILYDSLIEKFYNTYHLSNKDYNKFALLLRKGVYPYEYMDSWKRFNEPVPLVEDYYYSDLNKVGITKEDIKHVKNVCDTFKIKTLGEYHDLYV